MANCENCYHESVCKGIMNNVDVVYNPQKDAWITPENCLGYKDKSLIVELPCKVGDTVYQITRNFISEFRVRFIEVSKYDCIYIHTDIMDGIIFTGEIFSEDEIGKIVFLSREEAEKALKEREHHE